MPAPLIHLVEPDLAVLEAAVEGRRALERVLHRAVAEGWDVFSEALQATRDAVAADPASTRWGPRLFVLDEPRILVGWGGFKGPPHEGAVELGYAIAPSWEGRGLATAAARALLNEALAAPEVRTVLAHTLGEPGASVRVLQKTGFVIDGELVDEEVGKVWRFRLDFVR